MNRSVPISYDANMEPHKITSGSVKYINYVTTVCLLLTGLEYEVGFVLYVLIIH